MATATDRQALLTRNEAADFLCIKSQTLGVWASTGKYNLPFYKVGRSVRYRIADLEAFLQRRLVNADASVEA